MTTYYLLTRRQCTAIPATRAVLLSRTSGERWAVVRVGEGSVGVAPEGESIPESLHAVGLIHEVPERAE